MAPIELVVFDKTFSRSPEEVRSVGMVGLRGEWVLEELPPKSIPSPCEFGLAKLPLECDR